MPLNPDEQASLFAMYFRASSSTRVYSRRSYTVTMYLGDLGGLIDIIWAVGTLISAFFTINAL